MDLLALCRDLIAAQSVSHQGTARVIGVLKPLYEAAGLAVHVQEVVKDGVSQQNLLGTYEGADPGGLLLVTHLDTVDPGPLEMWTETSPFQLAQKGDLLFGLGSADTKLDALCKLFAAQALRGQRLRRRLQLLGTFEEEVGGKGARHFVRTPEFTARFVACSEPSELRIIRAHKGYAVVVVDLEAPPGRRLSGPFTQCVFDGKAAHSSTPHLGINAIERALAAHVGKPLVALEGGTVANKVPARCRVLVPSPAGAVPPAPGVDDRDASATVTLSARLFDAWKRLALAQEPKVNPAFDPDTCVVNWGVARVAGPTARLVFDARLLPGHDPDKLHAAFAKEAERLADGAKARVTVTVDRRNPAMELKEPSELLAAACAAAREVGLPDAPECKPTNTEAGIFAAAGVEAIVFGPGRSTGNAHCANEHNLYSQLEKAIELHRALIRRLCV